MGPLRVTDPVRPAPFVARTLKKYALPCVNARLIFAILPRPFDCHDLKLASVPSVVPVPTAKA